MGEYELWVNMIYVYMSIMGWEGGRGEGATTHTQTYRHTHQYRDLTLPRGLSEQSEF